ncbi:MAG: AAA family ATPase, partial [Nocardioidaceae bacterium]
MTDPEAFVDTFTTFLREVVRQHRADEQPLGSFVTTVNAYLGGDARSLAVVTEPLSTPRLPDADIALEALAAGGGEHRLLGVTGRHGRGDSSFAEMLRGESGALEEGPVDYTSMSVGPSQERQVVVFGVHLFAYEGVPVAVLQRGARPEYGRERPTLEVLAPDATLSSRLLQDIRRVMRERSVLRGQVVSFTGNEYESTLGGITFHSRPAVAADDVVLPAGTLERLERHAVLLGEHRVLLRAARQHLKRGILLYGPPGTGKTLTVRHLLSRTEGTTAVLLSGRSLGLISEAAQIARAMQPALVVLEDCDLVAEDRDMADGPDSLLFEVLEALDGLEGDADVTFLLTTNRPDLLERALTQRPGRVDLAIEIPLPDTEARRALFSLYARDLPFSTTALDEATVA